MPMYNLIEYSDSYSKISRGFWHYDRDEPAVTDAGAIANFHAADNSALFKFKKRITCVTDNDSARNVEIMVPLNI